MVERTTLETDHERPANCRMLNTVERVMRSILDRALSRGFYGVVGISLTIDDGTIQDVRENIEARYR